VPNRRRRKLSTAMSAVAALAVASPCAYFLVYESTAGSKPPEHHEFKRAATMADLPNELMGALSQGLSQFGINLPPVPALGGGGATTTGLTSPGLGSPGLTSPGLTSPGLTSPGLTSPSLANPGVPPVTPGVTTPGAVPMTPAAGMNPALSNPGLTSPAVTPGLGSSTLSPSEVPIDSQTGLDPGAGGTYPILGDPSTLGGASPIASGGGGGGSGGGLVNDLMQAANQLGASQAIDLLKGLVMPAIMQSVQQGAAGAPGAAGALPGAAGALPGAAGALPGAAAALPGAAKALPGAAAALPGAAGALPGAAGALPGAAGALPGAAGALPGAAAALPGAAGAAAPAAGALTGVAAPALPH
jgi:hypothetical protein